MIPHGSGLLGLFERNFTRTLLRACLSILLALACLGVSRSLAQTPVCNYSAEFVIRNNLGFFLVATNMTSSACGSNFEREVQTNRVFFHGGTGGDITNFAFARGKAFVSAYGGGNNWTLVGLATAEASIWNSLNDPFYGDALTSEIGVGATITMGFGQPISVQTFENGGSTGQSVIMSGSVQGGMSAAVSVQCVFCDSQSKSASGARVMTVSSAPPVGILRGMEVNQVIQDWKNSVIPLIADKATFVRAHIESLHPQNVGSPTVGRLHGFDAITGAPLPDSPISALNMGQLVRSATNLDTRGTLALSLNFKLPPDWVKTGAKRFQLEGQNFILQCAEPEDYFNPASNCTVHVFFKEPPLMPIRFIRVGYTNPATGLYHRPSKDAVYEMAALIPLDFPVGRYQLDIAKMHLNNPTKYIGELGLLLDALATRRLADGISTNYSLPIYYGVFDGPIQALNLGRPVSGVASFWDPVGCSVLPANAIEAGAGVAQHELSHIFGRDHSIYYAGFTNVFGYVMRKGSCKERAELDTPEFPYFYTNNFGDVFPSIGPMYGSPDDMVFGVLDFPGFGLTVQSPVHSVDLMSYCPGVGKQSKHTYEIIGSELAFPGPIFPLSSLSTSSPLPPMKFSSIVQGGSLPPSQLNGDPDHLLIRGRIDTVSNLVTWLPFYCLEIDPAPTNGITGEFTLELLNQSGAVLNSIPFDLRPYADSFDGVIGFQIPVALDPAIRQVRFKRLGTILSTYTASSNVPVVQVLTPNGGEVLTNENIEVTVLATDADGDTLNYTISYSHNGGTNWNTLSVDDLSASLLTERFSMKASTNGRIRVMVSDGFHCAHDLSDAAFTVANNPPMLQIYSPGNGARFHPPQNLVLDANSYDTEQGSLSLSNVLWQSDRQGVLGTSQTLGLFAKNMLVGAHVITASVTDAAGATASDTVTIHIDPFGQPRLRILSPPTNGYVPLQIISAVPAMRAIESSTNLVDWELVDARAKFHLTENYSAPVPNPDEKRFYRARLFSPGPVFVEQPSSMTVTQGQSFQLFAPVVGETAVRYQWLFNGALLAGETNAVLSFGPPEFSQSGNYQLVASNSLGVVTSATAVVSVVNPNYSILHWFGTNSLDGVNGYGPLALDTNGWLYGCTFGGAISNAGVVFKLRTNGADYTVLRRLTPATDGSTPLGGIALLSDGRLYGTCSIGGSNNSGTVFRMERDGTGFTVLKHFPSFGDCRTPQGEVLEGSDGKLYGTTFTGGGFGRGGLYKMNTDGTGYQILYGFKNDGVDGGFPSGGLVELGGLLYGTTESGGTTNKGTIFRIEKSGTNYLKLRDLGGVVGGSANPVGTLRADSTRRWLYGTTYAGGYSNLGTVFRLHTNNVSFNILKRFDNLNDPTEPRAGLVEAADGTFIGASRFGGGLNQGAVFRVNPNTLDHQVLHHFGTALGDGMRSRSSLLRAPDGIFYGTTFSGGTNNQGVIYRISGPGL